MYPIISIHLLTFLQMLLIKILCIGYMYLYIVLKIPHCSLRKYIAFVLKRAKHHKYAESQIAALN